MHSAYHNKDPLRAKLLPGTAKGSTGRREAGQSILLRLVFRCVHARRKSAFDDRTYSRMRGKATGMTSDMALWDDDHQCVTCRALVRHRSGAHRETIACTGLAVCPARTLLVQSHCATWYTRPMLPYVAVFRTGQVMSGCVLLLLYEFNRSFTSPAPTSTSHTPPSTPHPIARPLRPRRGIHRRTTARTPS